MDRPQNNQFNIDNAQRRPNSSHYVRSSLRRHLQEKWLTIGLGVIGFFLGVCLIISNEARAVKVSKFLEDSISLVSIVSPESEIDESNIGKLVYISGMMTVHEPLTEVDYGISVMAVKLLKSVQMYQWVESEVDVVDGEGNIVTTNYHYHKDWWNTLIDSSLFANSVNHWNPKEFPIKKQTQINENVKIGKYNLGLELKKKFTEFVPITSDERPERQDIKLHDGLYYHCQDIWNPEVGDVRIQFSYAGHHGEVVTVLAKLDNTLSLVPYSEYGVNILFLRVGYRSLENMFAFASSYNKFRMWIFRGVGWVVLYLSCVYLSTFLQIIVSHSPFLQRILPISHSSLKMTVSMCTSLMATAMAWIWYRPVLGVGLIVVSMSFLFCNKFFSVNRPQQYNRL